MVSYLKSLASYNLKEEVKPQPTISKEESIRDFRTALQAAPGLSVSTNDSYLLRFLRAKSFKIPDAVKLYKNTDAWKEKNAHILNIPLSKCMSAYNRKVMGVLKEKDEEGRTIIYIKADNWEPNEASLDALFKYMFALIDETQTIDENVINGISLILDMTDLSMPRTMEFLSHFSIKNIKGLIGFAQGGSPVKVKSIHAVSTPFVVYTTYSGVKYLIKRKMRNRIHVHYDGIQAVHKYFSKNKLPKFLGGNQPDKNAYDTDIMKSLFHKNNLIYTGP